MDEATMSELQLQLWDAKQKCYVLSPIDILLDPPRGKAWRICKPERETKNQKYHPSRSTRPSYSIDSVRAAYIAWANAKGLKKITDWSHKSGIPFWYGAVRTVDKGYADASYEEAHDV